MPLQRRPPRQLASTALCVAALLFIGTETLVPRPEKVALVEQTPIWCLICGDLGMLDVLLNVLLFVPLGAGLALRGLSWRRAMLLGAGLSLAIEVTQYFAIPGRDASLSDVLTNTTGTLAGSLLAISWRTWVRPAPAVARRFALGAAIAWLTQVTMTGAAVSPTLPSSVYWGQRAADLGQFDTFPGKVLGAWVGGLSLPGHRLANSQAVRHELLSGEPLKAVAVPAGLTEGLAPVVSIFDGEQREIAVLGQWEQDMVFRLRSRAIDLKLRPPAVRLASVFSPKPGDTLTLSGAVQSGRFVVNASGPAGNAARVLRLSAQWGWSLLLPFDYAFGPEVEWVSALWLIGWLLPIGFWIRRSGVRLTFAAPLAIGLLALGLTAIPALFQQSGSLGEWAAGLAGIAAGWWLGGATRVTSRLGVRARGPIGAGVREP